MFVHVITRYQQIATSMTKAYAELTADGYRPFRYNNVANPTWHLPRYKEDGTPDFSPAPDPMHFDIIAADYFCNTFINVTAESQLNPHEYAVIRFYRGKSGETLERLNVEHRIYYVIIKRAALDEYLEKISVINESSYVVSLVNYVCDAWHTARDIAAQVPGVMGDMYTDLVKRTVAEDERLTEEGIEKFIESLSIRYALVALHEVAGEPIDTISGEHNDGIYWYFDSFRQLEAVKDKTTVTIVNMLLEYDKAYSETIE